MKPILFALAFLVFNCAIARPVHAQAVQTQPLDGIVAVVDEDVVLQSELDSQIQAVTAQYASKPSQLPPQDVLEHQLLDRLILQKLQVSKAASTGVKVSDAEVDRALLQVATQNKMDVSQLRGAIESQGLNYDQFRRNIADQVIVQQLRQRVAQTQVQVSEAEIDSLVKNGNLNAGQLHLGYILINVPDGATPDQIDAAKAKAEEARKQIEGGMDFAAAAIRYSNADNALQGGDLGWRSRNELPPPLVTAADQLQIGGVSDPLRGPNGFHLIKLVDKRDADQHMVTEYNARQILIRVDELVSSADAKRKIDAIRQKIVAGEEFAKAAKDSSQDEATARLGGELGWFPIDAFGPTVAGVVKSLKVGEVSEPFQSTSGWHIVKLADTRTVDKSGDMKREEARNILFQRKAEDEYESFLRQLRSESYVEIRLPGSDAKPAATPKG